MTTYLLTHYEVFRWANWSKVPRFQAESWLIRREGWTARSRVGTSGQNDGFTYIFTPCYEYRWSAPQLTVGFRYSSSADFSLFLSASLVSLKIFNFKYENYSSLGFALCCRLCPGKTCAWWLVVRRRRSNCRNRRMHGFWSMMQHSTFFVRSTDFGTVWGKRFTWNLQHWTTGQSCALHI